MSVLIDKQRVARTFGDEAASITVTGVVQLTVCVMGEDVEVSQHGGRTHRQEVDRRGWQAGGDGGRLS